MQPLGYAGKDSSGQYVYLSDCHAMANCGQWQKMVDGPAKSGPHVTATAGGEVVVTGGWGLESDSRTPSSHMLKDGVWTALGSLPKGVVDGCQVEVENKILLIGR